MGYELWNIDGGHGIARCDREDEALALVRTLLAHHGRGYCSALDLSAENDLGEVVASWTGEDLAVRAEAMMAT